MVLLIPLDSLFTPQQYRFIPGSLKRTEDFTSSRIKIPMGNGGNETYSIHEDIFVEATSYFQLQRGFISWLSFEKVET